MISWPASQQPLLALACCASFADLLSTRPLESAQALKPILYNICTIIKTKTEEF